MPDVIELYFESVGDCMFDAVLCNANAFARIALCGRIANDDGKPVAIHEPALMQSKRMRIEEFVIAEHLDQMPHAQKDLIKLVKSGKLKLQESIARGIDKTADVLLGLLKGRNLGKQLVEVR